LCFSKLDVLDTFDELKISVAYIVDQQRFTSFPADLTLLEKAEIEYETLPGWKQDTSNVRKFHELPENAQKYIHRVETLLGIPIRWVGVGSSRDAIIQHDNTHTNLFYH
jgi:adenylosuccinate synthase